MRKYLCSLALAASAFLFEPACAPDLVYVRVGPPVPIVEARVVAPGPGYVWISGFYRWDGRAYFWVPGRWERPPSRYHAWVPGHWAQRRRGWYWVEGHWRR